VIPEVSVSVPQGGKSTRNVAFKLLPEDPQLSECCLSGEVDNMCQVELLLKSAPIMFVKKVQDKFCFYCGHFGYSCLCSCPVRIELYKRYGV
jgi:hypothetical protein